MTEQKTVAIIQGRMAASRLPGKVLLDIGGQPMLGRVVERVRRAHRVDSFMVATTNDSSDNPVEEYCHRQDYPVYRGDMFDVLDRFYQAALQIRAEVVVRITADCPVIDPGLIDLTVSEFLHASADFAANRLPPPWKRTFPIGLDVEVCMFAALERAWKEADQKYQREHVMPYLYEGIPVDAFNMTRTSLAVSPRGFRVLLVNHVPDYSSMRWTVDTVEDLVLMREIYSHFGGCDTFSWEDVLELFRRNPDLAAINSKVVHKTAFDTDKRLVDGSEKTR
jgi:spore coat polysaccharide biosynthesis protein SpsF